MRVWILGYLVSSLGSFMAKNLVEILAGARLRSKQKKKGDRILAVGI